MTTLAQLISEEIQKEDFLKDIKEPLIKAMTAQFKKEGLAKIRWAYEDMSAEVEYNGGYCINVRYKERLKPELQRWLREQGFYFKTVYGRVGGEWGLEVTLPGY